MEKKLESLPERKVSNIIEFGNEQNKVVIETVASFRNMMNLMHKPRHKERYLEETFLDGNGKEQKREVREIERIYYPFEESPEFEFVMAQSIKLYLEGKEVDLTSNNLVKFFDREPLEYSKIQKALSQSVDDKGFPKN